MKVCIIRYDNLRTRTGEPAYQIMKRINSGFAHVYPGKLFTLEEATMTAAAAGYIVEAVGGFWECVE